MRTRSSFARIGISNIRSIQKLSFVVCTITFHRASSYVQLTRYAHESDYRGAESERIRVIKPGCKRWRTNKETFRIVFHDNYVRPLLPPLPTLRGKMLKAASRSCFWTIKGGENFEWANYTVDVYSIVWEGIDEGSVRYRMSTCRR